MITGSHPQSDEIVGVIGHLWRTDVGIVVTPEGFTTDGDVKLTLAWDHSVDRLFRITDETHLPPLVRLVGAKSGNSLVVSRIEQISIPADSWLAPVPHYVGHVPKGATHWGQDAQRAAWDSISAGTKAAIVSFKALHAGADSTVFVAVCNDMQAARGELSAVFCESLIVKQARWSAAQFDEIYRHVGARRQDYKVLLTGVRVRDDGYLECYAYVESLTAELAGWSETLPPGALVVRSWMWSASTNGQVRPPAS